MTDIQNDALKQTDALKQAKATLEVETVSPVEATRVVQGELVLPALPGEMPDIRNPLDCSEVYSSVPVSAEIRRKINRMFDKFGHIDRPVITVDATEVRVVEPTDGEDGK